MAFGSIHFYSIKKITLDPFPLRLLRSHISALVFRRVCERESVVRRCSAR